MHKIYESIIKFKILQRGDVQTLLAWELDFPQGSLASASMKASHQ